MIYCIKILNYLLKYLITYHFIVFLINSVMSINIYTSNLQSTRLLRPITIFLIFPFFYLLVIIIIIVVVKYLLS